jgi:predicted TIM-barrel fold metal-dependent hydrolase
LREYCPKQYLDDFDAFATCFELPEKPALELGVDPNLSVEETRKTRRRNVLTRGGVDPHARLRDMDYDGVVAETIFHGLNAGPDNLPIPFHLLELQPPPPGAANYSNEFLGVGRHLYNQWLGEFCSVDPNRLIGLAQLPMWDVAAAVKEVEWAASVGLRGVNFPRPNPKMPPYNHPVWDDFWAACTANGMSLHTHSQGIDIRDDEADQMERNARGMLAVKVFDIGNYGCRTAIHQLIFGGVFERFPSLKIMFSENMGQWWSKTLHELDDAFYGLPRSMGITDTQNALTGDLPNPPSYYANRNVFIGYTCIANFEVQEVSENNYVHNVMWGRDYPHPEGAYQYPTFDGEESWCRKALRDSFEGIDLVTIARIAGENAVDFYGLDVAKLREIAERIEAPTLGELTTPSGFVPDRSLPETPFWFTFRKSGVFN